MPAPLHFHRQQSTAKRKVPKARLKSASPTFKHRLKEDISQIRLHQDLTSHLTKNEILPEVIIKSYREQYQSNIAAAACAAAEAAAVTEAITPSPCQALILYTPREKVIHEVLHKSIQSESVGRKNAKAKAESMDMT